MKVMVHLKGIFCERGGLVKIKGSLFAVTMGFNNVEKKRMDMFRTTQQGLLHMSLPHAPYGDERPITLAEGDYLYFPSFYEVTLETRWDGTADYLKIGGYLFTDEKYEVITVNDLSNISGPKNYWVRFEKGNQSVLAEFDLEVTDRSFY
jgi:hypothetical protein